jgi:hypothetical protein
MASTPPDNSGKRRASAFDELLRFGGRVSATDTLLRQLDAVDPRRQLKAMMKQAGLASSLDALLYSQAASAQRLGDSIVASQTAHAEGMRRTYEKFIAAVDPGLEIQARLLANSKPVEAIVAASSLPRELRHWIAELADGQSLKKASEVTRLWTEPYEEIRKSLARFEKPLTGDFAASLLASLERTSFQATVKDVSSFLHAQKAMDGAFRLRAEQAARSIAVEAASKPTVEAALESLITTVAETKDSNLQKVLWFFLVPLVLLLINAVVAPVGDFYVKRALEGPKQEAVKSVKAAAADAVGDLTILKNYRFVDAKTLRVRESPSSRSHPVGDLRFGQTVRVLSKQTDFTLVQWSNTDGTAQLQGWVFSRYLRRFD